VLKKSASKSIVQTVHTIGKKLVFAEEIAYSACKGYPKPSSRSMPDNFDPPENIAIPFGRFTSEPSSSQQVSSSAATTPLEILNSSPPDGLPVSGLDDF
jgi:hypothetical protein